MDSIGKRLKQAMDDRGFEVDDLVAKNALSRAGVYQWLNDTVKRDKVRDETVQKLCKVLGIRRDWLMDGRGPMNAASSSHPVGLDVGKLASLLATVESAVEKARIKLPPMVKARLVATLYADQGASEAASAQAVQSALMGILATMETSDEPDATG